ncbi:hypothetical protein [Marinobacter sp. DUT-1]|uniref:hypothetical protein n=1 Tax=Marinobacter sp. DUT-1 TaxID=3412037 RepID=UPI003D165D18
MTNDDETNAPGTAKPAKVRKAACGIRFDEDELQEGIDFSGAAALKPEDEELSEAQRPLSGRRNRKADRHS